MSKTMGGRRCINGKYKMFCAYWAQWRVQVLTVEGDNFQLNQFKNTVKGSGSMLPRYIFKSKTSNNAFYSIFRPKYGQFWGILNGGLKAI